MRTLLLLLLISCSFKGKDESKGISAFSADSDGDFVSDGEEIEQGRNPNQAELPNFEFKFIRNFKLKSGEDLILEANEVDPNAQAKVSSPEIKESLKRSIGKFAGLESITYEALDFNGFHKIKFPELSMMDLMKLKSIEADSVDLEFDNFIKLSRINYYDSIKNPELVFYYYNHDLESLEEIDRVVIEREFLLGSNETFSINLSAVPVVLIKENLLKRGEFLYVEIADYEIPNLTTNFQTLMRSILESTVPLVVSTPVKTDVYYVAAAREIRFIDLLKEAFGESVRIEDNKLIQVNEISNNLGAYESLSELRGEHKKGKWFIQSSQVKTDLYESSFSVGDVVALSYLTGDELSRIVRDKNAFEFTLDSEELNKEQDLGDISKNSTVYLKLDTTLRNRDWVNSINYSIGPDWGGYKEFLYHEVRLNKQALVASHSEVASRIHLEINNTSKSLVEILKDQRIIALEVDGNLILEINNLHDILGATEGELDHLKIKVTENSTVQSVGMHHVVTSGWAAGRPGTHRDEAICTNVGRAIDARVGYYVDVSGYCSERRPHHNMLGAVLKPEHSRRNVRLKDQIIQSFQILKVNYWN